MPIETFKLEEVRARCNGCAGGGRRLGVPGRAPVCVECGGRGVRVMMVCGCGYGYAPATARRIRSALERAGGRELERFAAGALEGC